MLYQDGMIADSIIKIMAINWTGGFAVVVEKSEHPFAGLCIVRSLVQECFDLFDGILVACDFAKMPHAGFHGMGVCIVETGKNGFEARSSLRVPAVASRSTSSFEPTATNLPSVMATA
jgi:hypothetical protein